MPRIQSFGIAGPRKSFAQPAAFEHIVLDRPLLKVLEFARRSIHDVVNDPLAKREVQGYYKLHREIQRRCEAVDMNRWWMGNRR